MAYTYARPRSPHRHWPKLLALAVVCFPHSLSRLDFRANFSRGLSISAHHASPAFAALEDANADFAPELDDLGDLDLPTLRVPERAVPHEAPSLRYVALAGSSIRRPTPPEEVKPNTAVAHVPNAEPADSEPERSLGRVTERLVRRELADARAERVIASTLGTKIIVRGNASAHPPRALAGTATAFAPRLEPAPDRPSSERSMWLDGRLEMTGGLAFTGDDAQMVIKRTLEGRTRETGRIWITEGRFEIQVERPRGSLVAEIRGRDGRVFGRGEINLRNLAGSAAIDQGRIGDLKIALRPTTEIASLRAISAYSHRDHKIGMPDARVEIQSISQALSVDDEGFAQEPELGRQSTFLARAEAKGYRPTLAVAHGDRTRDLRLMPEKMMRALVELARRPGERAHAELSGVVWGSVNADGQPTAGARVELASGLEPIYFNDLFLPDRGLDATGGNGLFAFLDVPSGVQAARVTVGERQYPAQVFATEDQHVSVVDFELRDDARALVRVFDPLDAGRPRAADLRWVGADGRVAVEGEGAVSFASAGGASMMEAEADPEYEVSRIDVADEPNELSVPLVRKAWLETLFAARSLAVDPGRGTVVGFVAETDFEVGMTGTILNERLNVIYFDAAGRVLDRPTGAAGGGFAILNAPAGLQTVRITPVHSRQSFAQVVVAEPNRVHVVTWAPPER